MICPRPTAGFTLIELMIVVAIIAILAAIAIPQYADYVARTEFSESNYLSDSLKSSVADYYGESGKCPTNATSGFLPAGSYSGKYVDNVVLGGTPPQCTITTQFKATQVALLLQGKTAILTSTGQGGVMSWDCSAPSIPAHVLPQTCR